MPTYMKIQPSTGQAVQIFTSELTLDPAIYRVAAQDRNIISLREVCKDCSGNANKLLFCKTCNETGEVGKRQVHHSRIARVLDESLKVVYEVNFFDKEKPVADAKQTKAVSTNAVDLKTLIGNGEHFAKAVSFDHDGVSAAAHVVINADHKSFIVFNTYNGTLGKKGKSGKNYPIADEKAYSEKVSQLTKQGYTKS